MTDDSRFIAAIVADPRNDDLRLVYADWLEERCDLRGEFLRLDVALRRMQGNETNYAVLATRWEDLWTHPLVSSTWLVAVLGPESPIPLPLCGWYLGDHLFPYDSDACLKLCADGFWIYKDSHDSAFRFSDFLASLDLVELKTRFPQGTCARSGPDILYQTGRYRRFGNRLELSSWDEQEGREFVWLTLSIVSPGRMVSGPNRDNWEFIPDPAAEPGRGT